MTELPSDLIPLPSAPWDERPVEIPVSIEEARTALWLDKGIVSKAAQRLKVPSARLRRLVNNSPYLRAEIEEAKEQIKDLAEENVIDALTDANDPGRRDSMSRFVLGGLGRDRGFGSGAGGISLSTSGKGKMIIAWDDGTSIGGDEKVIEADA